jgi:hypothetical protein
MMTAIQTGRPGQSLLLNIFYIKASGTTVSLRMQHTNPGSPAFPFSRMVFPISPRGRILSVGRRQFDDIGQAFPGVYDRLSGKRGVGDDHTGPPV